MSGRMPVPRPSPNACARKKFVCVKMTSKKDAIRGVGVFDRVRAELTKESRQSELNREVERCRRACGPIDAGLLPGPGGESKVREIGR